ncbi:plasminogen activator inhibitor [Parasponia andersonii]|uniref:Plasminogen activator inhibitor n=1 Tax=Parasponia andersonii TaxID=3476 RepID=A0A2P5DFB8_PARAD|nr:plasminogen activator inhibitor [Parasponia andersonii]
MSFALDVAVLSFVTALLLLSVFSISFILHLCFKSRTSHHLQRFNSLWTVRFLLVLFITLWALNELLRLPLLRRTTTTAGPAQQATLCKIHVALSLGLFEPAFLGTLLFLVDFSIKKETPNGRWAVASILATCLPLLCLQTLVLFSSKTLQATLRLPDYFLRSSVARYSGPGETTVLCAYPLLSTAAFGAFGLGFSAMFLVSAWRVASVVINKALRVRIYGLALTVLISLPVQIVMLGLSAAWTPDDDAYGGVSLAVFLSTLSCAVVGEGILVIKPIADSLAVRGQSCCPWDPWRRQVAGGRA